MRKLLLAVLAVTLGLTGPAHAVCNPITTTCYTAIDVSGNATVGSLTNTGASAVTGNQTVTGNQAVTGTLTVTGAVSQSTTTFTGAFLPWPKTIAQLNALTSGTTGQIVSCTDCTKSGICISSGTTAPGAWVVAVVSTNTGAGYTTIHCQ